MYMCKMLFVRQKRSKGISLCKKVLLVIIIILLALCNSSTFGRAVTVSTDVPQRLQGEQVKSTQAFAAAF